MTPENDPMEGRAMEGAAHLCLTHPVPRFILNASNSALMLRRKTN